MDARIKGARFQGAIVSGDSELWNLREVIISWDTISLYSLKIDSIYIKSDLEKRLLWILVLCEKVLLERNSPILVTINQH